MAELISLFKERKSIRRFTHHSLDADTIHTIIEAGTSAPSLCNLQPWRYKVVSTPDIPSLLPFTSMHFIENASCVIVCCLDKEVIQSLGIRTMELMSHGILKDTIYESLDRSVIKDSFKDYNYISRNLYISIGTSIHQMCLQATSMGLGSCMITLFDEHSIKQTFSLPSSLEVVTLLAIGKASSGEIDKSAPKFSISKVLI